MLNAFKKLVDVIDEIQSGYKNALRQPKASKKAYAESIGVRPSFAYAFDGIVRMTNPTKSYLKDVNASDSVVAWFAGIWQEEEISEVIRALHGERCGAKSLDRLRADIDTRKKETWRREHPAESLVSDFEDHMNKCIDSFPHMDKYMLERITDRMYNAMEHVSDEILERFPADAKHAYKGWKPVVGCAPECPVILTWAHNGHVEIGWIHPQIDETSGPKGMGSATHWAHLPPTDVRMKAARAPAKGKGANRVREIGPGD